VFHLADYPIFLGVAAYLILRGLDIAPYGIRPLDIVRWAAAVTLMWASVEKWAYPQWTDPLIAAKPEMTMGASPELFMQAAGVIEFTLAFALLWTPLVRRTSALILAGVFVSAVFEFGKIDAIGHSGIIVVLLGIAADDIRAKARVRDVVLAPAWYAASLAALLTLYYLGHAALYGGLSQMPVI
jgi:vacuolar-type H+-ATPase subunit I/STV1